MPVEHAKRENDSRKCDSRKQNTSDLELAKYIEKPPAAMPFCLHFGIFASARVDTARHLSPEDGASAALRVEGVFI